MRVATYTESATSSSKSPAALAVLLLTVLLGTGVVPTIAAFAGGVFPQLMTPLWLVLYAGAFMGLMFSHGINWITWLVRYRILLVFLLIGAIVSVSWSIDAQVSAERVTHLIGSSLIAIYIGFTIPLLTTLRIFALMLGLTMLATIGAALILPELGIESYEGTQVWRGVFNSKNDLGFWAGVGVLLYITLSESFHSISIKLMCFVMAGVCLGVLALSQSATSLIAMAVAGALSLYLYIASRFKLSFYRMAFLAILFVALTALAIANIETTELVGRSGDLTGRGEVWRQVLKLIADHPLTGVGYGSLWFPTDATLWIQQGFFDFTWIVYHAHNGLLQIASEIGVPLALIAILMVAQQLIEIFYCQYERQQVGVLFVLGFVIAFLISNYAEARFMVTRELFWIFFVALPISMLRQINLVAAEGQTPSDISFSDSGIVAYAGVPGKPWLGPLPSELETPHSSWPAQSTEAATNRIQYQGEDEELGHHHDDTADQPDSTMSLTETDIDLGSLFDDEAEDQHDDSLNVSGELADRPEMPSSVDRSAKRTAAREPETFDHDDTFDVDRYDVDFAVESDWVDIDLDEKK